MHEIEKCNKTYGLQIKIILILLNKTLYTFVLTHTATLKLRHLVTLLLISGNVNKFFAEKSLLKEVRKRMKEN